MASHGYKYGCSGCATASTLVACNIGTVSPRNSPTWNVPCTRTHVSCLKSPAAAQITGRPSAEASATQQLTATPMAGDGSALPGRVVTWSSDNTNVATVTGTGLVAGVGPGTASITATSEGQTGASSITVTIVPVASVSVSPGAASIVIGATQQLNATPLSGDGMPLTGRVITWSSDNTGVFRRRAGLDSHRSRPQSNRPPLARAINGHGSKR